MVKRKLRSQTQQCRSCLGPLYRQRRNWPQCLQYSSLYQCGQCGQFTPESRNWLLLDLSPTVSCPRCTTPKLKIQRKRDSIEGFQRGLWRWVQGLMGAKLYYCRPCRLQFYDLRRRQPDVESIVQESLQDQPVSYR